MALIALHYTGLLPLAALTLYTASALAASRLLGGRAYRLAVSTSITAAAVAALLAVRSLGGGAAAYALLGYAVVAVAALLSSRGVEPEKLYRYATILLVAGWLLYWVPFVTLDFTLHEVFWNTSEGLPLWMRFAAAWSGGGGSLFLFALFAGVGGYYLLRGTPERRALLVAAASLVTAVGLTAAFLNDAFTLLEQPPAAGAGLNPLLKSPWLYPHPLSTFGGYALLAIAAVGMLAGGVDRRSWTVYELGWALLTLGIMLGGYWSYETFGWGGYWAWDPVETSELMVWLAATLLPHAMVAARSLRGFAAGLLGSSVFLAMYVTRTGLSPLHSFAAPGIGALILLSSALVLLGYAVYRLGLGLEGVANDVRMVLRRRTPYSVGMFVAAVALLAAALFVYGTLFTPSVMIALGEPASVPQMDAGIRYFHPVLYPLLLVLLAAIPMAFLGDYLGWNGLAALLGTTAALSLALGLAALKGVYSLAPLSPSETNAMMAAGLPWAGVAAAATLVYLYTLIRRRGLARALADRMAPMSLLHLGLAVTVIGVLLSGTYAFNKGYTWELHLKPGETVTVPGNHTVKFVGYEFGISSSRVDIYTDYVGRSPIYFYAQAALRDLAHFIGNYFKYYMEGKKIIYSNSTLRSTFILSHQSPLSVDDVGENTTVNATLYTVMGGENAIMKPIRLYLGNATVELGGVNVTVFAKTDRQGVKPVGWLAAYIDAGLLRVSFAKQLPVVPKKYIAEHDFLDIHFSPPLRVRINDSVVLEVEWARVLPEILVRGGEGEPINLTKTGLAGVNAVLLVYNGTLILNGSRLPLPYRLPTPVAGYLAVFQDNTLFGLLVYTNGTSLFKLLSNPSLVFNLTVPRSGASLAGPGAQALGYVDAPRTIPETAWLDIILRVDNSSTMRLRIRFEAYGEIQGIHGLVSKVVHPARGLDDVYVVVSPPVDPGDLTGSPYHSLLLYYLHQVFRELPPEKRLALAALMAAGYNLDALKRMSPDKASATLAGSIVDLYVMAERYKPGSLIEEQGLNVQVKIIPGVRLVWLGPVLMSLSAVMAAFSALIRSRLERG